MAYERKHTDAELSKIRSENAKRGAATRRANGTCRGGRPRGMKSDTDPMATLTAHRTDHSFIDRMAFQLGTSKSSCIRILICQYRALHGDVKCGGEAEARLDASAQELARFITPKTGTDSASNC